MNYKKEELLKNQTVTIKRENTIEKLKRFLITLFSKKKQLDNVETRQEPKSMEEDFKNRIQVEHDTEEERLLKLQKQYEQNDITEEQISEDDKIELKGLYYMQILKSKMRIKRYKEKIENKA